MDFFRVVKLHLGGCATIGATPSTAELELAFFVNPEIKELVLGGKKKLITTKF